LASDAHIAGAADGIRRETNEITRQQNPFGFGVWVIGADGHSYLSSFGFPNALRPQLRTFLAMAPNDLGVALLQMEPLS